jgi:hypothetical protein
MWGATLAVCPAEALPIAGGWAADPRRDPGLFSRPFRSRFRRRFEMPKPHIPVRLWAMG